MIIFSLGIILYSFQSHYRGASSMQSFRLLMEDIIISQGMNNIFSIDDFDMHLFFFFLKVHKHVNINQMKCCMCK